MDPVASNTKPAVVPAVAPRFSIAGDSIEDLIVGLTEAVLKESQHSPEYKFDIMDNKSGNGSKYAIWDLSDGLETGRNAGLGLTPQQAKRLPTSDGVPAILSCSLVMRQLTPLANIAVKNQERRAATFTKVTKLEAQLDAARKAKARLEQ